MVPGWSIYSLRGRIMTLSSHRLAQVPCPLLWRSSVSRDMWTWPLSLVFGTPVCVSIISTASLMPLNDLPDYRGRVSFGSSTGG